MPACEHLVMPRRFSVYSYKYVTLTSTHFSIKHLILRTRKCSFFSQTFKMRISSVAQQFPQGSRSDLREHLHLPGLEEGESPGLVNTLLHCLPENMKICFSSLSASIVSISIELNHIDGHCLLITWSLVHIHGFHLSHSSGIYKASWLLLQWNRAIFGPKSLSPTIAIWETKSICVS